MAKIGTIFFIFLFFLSVNSFSQEEESTVNNSEKVKELTKNLKIIRTKLVLAEREAKVANDDFNHSNQALLSLDSEIKTLDKTISKENDELSKIEKKISSLSFQIDDIKSQIQDKKNSLRERIIGMYKTRRGLPAISFIMASENMHSIYRRASYIQKLLEKDSNQLIEFENLIETLKNSVLEVSNLRKNEEQIKLQLESKKDDLLKKKIDEAKRVRDLKALLEKREITLTSLKKQEDDFENTVRELTGGTSIPEEEISNPVIPPKNTSPYSGSISLAYPVDGKIIQHFGKHKHDDFKEMVETKGVEFSCLASSDVKAALPGRVVFNSELASYGNVVILEHDNRLFSLYGRIISSVSIGQELSLGETLGKSTEVDEKGRNFYFELRKNGSPLNPEKYFNKIKS